MSATIRVNGEKRVVSAATLDELLREETIDPEAKGVAVAINGSVVPRRAWSATRLAAGDAVEIVKPFSGG